jgi:hypothetical protein
MFLKQAYAGSGSSVCKKTATYNKTISGNKAVNYFLEFSGNMISRAFPLIRRLFHVSEVRNGMHFLQACTV